MRSFFLAVALLVVAVPARADWYFHNTPSIVLDQASPSAGYGDSGHCAAYIRDYYSAIPPLPVGTIIADAAFAGSSGWTVGSGNVSVQFGYKRGTSTYGLIELIQSYRYARFPYVVQSGDQFYLEVYLDDTACDGSPMLSLGTDFRVVLTLGSATPGTIGFWGSLFLPHKTVGFRRRRRGRWE